MAIFLLGQFKCRPDLLIPIRRFYVIPSNNDQGIIWWINKIQPGLKIKINYYGICKIRHGMKWTVRGKKMKIATYIPRSGDSMTQTKWSLVSFPPSECGRIIHKTKTSSLASPKAIRFLIFWSYDSGFPQGETEAFVLPTSKSNISSA